MEQSTNPRIIEWYKQNPFFYNEIYDFGLWDIFLKKPVLHNTFIEGEIYDYIETDRANKDIKIIKRTPKMLYYTTRTSPNSDEWWGPAYPRKKIKTQNLALYNLNKDDYLARRYLGLVALPEEHKYSIEYIELEEGYERDFVNATTKEKVKKFSRQMSMYLFNEEIGLSLIGASDEEAEKIMEKYGEKLKHNIIEFNNLNN